LIEEITENLFKEGSILVVGELEKFIEPPEMWKEITKEFEKQPILATSEFQQWIGKRVQYMPVPKAVKLLHKLGYIIEFNQSGVVVMNPLWLADMFKSIISLK
jgi:hypothetical protein